MGWADGGQIEAPNASTPEQHCPYCGTYGGDHTRTLRLAGESCGFLCFYRLLCVRELFQAQAERLVPPKSCISPEGL